MAFEGQGDAYTVNAGRKVVVYGQNGISLTNLAICEQSRCLGLALACLVLQVIPDPSL